MGNLISHDGNRASDTTFHFDAAVGRTRRGTSAAGPVSTCRQVATCDRHRQLRIAAPARIPASA
jgi:hypothetical protein